MHTLISSARGGDTAHFVTTDDLEKLKQRARKLKREQKIPHHEALELAAQQARFGNWHQVTEAHKAMQPTEHAVRDGIVIAMDVKEVVEHAADEIELKDGRGHFVADRLLPAFYRDTVYELYRNSTDEEDGRPITEKWTDEEIVEFAQDWMDDLAFYRYVGDRPPRGPETVLNLVANAAYWRPMFVWISGVMHDTYAIFDNPEHAHVDL